MNHSNHSINIRLICFIIIIFFSLFPIGSSQAKTIGEQSLTHPDTLSFVLLEEAKGKDILEAQELIKKAIQVSPNNPAAHFALFERAFSVHPINAFSSLRYLFKGIISYKNNFWWMFNLYGIFIGSLFVSVFLLILIIAIARLPVDMPLLIHESEENIKNIAYTLVLFTSLFGAYYFFSSLVFLTYLHIKERGRYAGYLLLLVLILMPVLGKYFSIYLTASYSPELKAVVSANEGRSTAYPIQQLKGKSDFTLRFSYALALQRAGRIQDAEREYQEILAFHRDPRIFINLGNCYAAMNLLDEAMEIYQNSLMIEPLSSAYYNLSIIAREKLDFTAGDKYFLEAVKIDFERVFERVTQFRELQFELKTVALMTETLSIGELLSFAIKKGKDYFGLSSEGLFLFTLFSILLIAILLSKRGSPSVATRCPKCGKIFCHRCEGSHLWGGICSDCFRDMVSYETNPSKRVERILKMYHYQERRRKILYILSFSIPGIPLIISNRIFTGIITSFVFVSFASLAILSKVFTFNITSYSHDWLMVISFIMVLVIYSVSSIYTVRRLRRGWL